MVKRYKEDINHRLAVRAKSIRISRGLSLADVSANLGITPQFLSAMEGGYRLMSAVMMVQIADALDVTPNQLIGDDPVDPDLAAASGS